MTHTRTPWTLTHINGNNFAVQEFEIRGMFGVSPNVSPIFNKDRHAIDGAHIFISPEDAAHIVKCVNVHDELLEALELNRALDKPHSEGMEILKTAGFDYSNRFDLPPSAFVREKTNAAISKAKGES